MTLSETEILELPNDLVNPDYQKFILVVAKNHDWIYKKDSIV